jgi:hypothetical protein
MIYHIAVPYGKQIRFSFLSSQLLPVKPQDLKAVLHDIPRIFFMPEILQDEPEQVIRMQIHALIIFLFRHPVKLCR